MITGKRAKLVTYPRWRTLSMRSWELSDKKPCGTLAAARRHYRHGEKLCEACRQAERRDSQDRYWKGKRGDFRYPEGYTELRDHQRMAGEHSRWKVLPVG